MTVDAADVLERAANLIEYAQYPSALAWLYSALWLAAESDEAAYEEARKALNLKMPTTVALLRGTAAELRTAE